MLSRQYQSERSAKHTYFHTENKMNRSSDADDDKKSTPDDGAQPSCSGIQSHKEKNSESDSVNEKKIENDPQPSCSGTQSSKINHDETSLFKDQPNKTDSSDESDWSDYEQKRRKKMKKKKLMVNFEALAYI